MTVESLIMVRAGGDGSDENPFGPRQADLAPYPSLAWSDMTGRPGTAALQQTEPRLLVIRGRMSNPDAVAMSTDPKLWMIESRQFSIDEDGNEVEIQNTKDDPYTEQERATRIAQLSNITAFDADTIAAWWTPEKTRREIATKLRDYLRRIDANDPVSEEPGEQP